MGDRKRLSTREGAGKMKSKQGKVLRQNRVNRFVHWTTAVSVFLLIVTGLGQLPLYVRYNVTKLPGADWLGNFFSTLKLHYIGAAALMFVVSFHMVNAFLRKEYDIFPRKGDLRESYLIIKAMFTKGQEPPSDKYLAEQRVAYAFIGGSLILLIITGLIKMIKNLPDVELPKALLFWATQLHNLGTVLIILGIIGHLAAFLIKENRALLPGMFTGYIDREYVKHRHSKWYARLLPEDKTASAGLPVLPENKGVPSGHGTAQ